MIAPYVGQRARRVEDPLPLTGRQRFLDDVRMPGVVSAAFLRSPHAHARIVEVDTRRALAAPGVLAALTGADVRRRARPIRAMLARPEYKVTDWPALAWDRVRFVGEPVAVVVAADRYLAEDAVEQVQANYERLVPITRVADALRLGAPRVHEDLPDNVLMELHFDNGRTDEAFRRAEVVLRETFRHGRCTAAPIEPRGVMAYFNRARGTLTVWSSTQSAHVLRQGLGESLGLLPGKLRVIAPAVGGSFGLKMQVFPEEVTVALLALTLDRPVKWVEDRREGLLASPHAREDEVTVELGARRDGRILGLRATLRCDLGAYSAYPTTAVLEPASFTATLPGPYAVEGYRYDAYAVATTKCPAGAYRGVGMVMATFVRERLLDMLARRLAIDPIAVRRRNFVAPGAFPYVSAAGVTIDGADYERTLDAMLDAAGRSERQAVPSQAAAGWARGTGIAVYSEPTAPNVEAVQRRGVTQMAGFDTARVELDREGAVRAFVSASSQGQGHATTLAQIVADELGVPLGDVTIDGGDTEACPFGAGAFASRTAVSTGGAVSLAAREVRRAVLEAAARLLEAAVPDLEIEGGEIRVRGVPDRTLSLREVARRAGPLEATRTLDPPATFSNGAHLAVVEVERATGRVRVIRHIVAEDCGRLVNPAIVEGQVHGGVAQAIGEALYEAHRYDDDGQLLTASFMDYLLPTAMEIPPIDVVHVHAATGGEALRVKGAGEGAIIGGVAAVVNAVAAALGVDVCTLPVTPEAICWADREDGGRE